MKKAKNTSNKFYSIHEIYGKGFKFAVDRYEEWENGRCTNQSELNGEIVAEVRGKKITFTISGVERLDIVNTVSMDFSNPMSGIMESGDRIQYFSDSNRADIPYICHLFYESGRISYIRFALLNPSSFALLPMPKRIYEFYGNMNELFDSEKVQSSANEFSPFVFESTCHQRYEHHMHVGEIQHCLRTVFVEKNIDGCSGYDITPGDGYIVKLYNNDVGRPNMSDKPMRIKSISKDLVVLQGYPVMAMSPFGWTEVNYEDYGLEVHYRDGSILKCVFHMYDRDTFIEYI